MSVAEDGSGKGSNLTAVEAISAKMAEVKHLAEQVDAKLSVFGVQTRPEPATSSAMSSASSSSSIRAATTSATGLGKIQPILAGASSTTAACSSPATALTSSSSASTVAAPQTKCVSIIVKDSLTSGLVTSTPVASSGTICTSVLGAKGDPAELECAKMAEKLGERPTRDTDVEDIFDKSFDDSLADDSNMEGYVTATECSITPTARSRSESFVTSPDCEDLAAPATVTSASDAWWNVEEPKFTTTNAALSTAVDKQMEGSEEQEKEKESKESTDISKPEVPPANEEKQIEKILSLGKRVEEKSGKIVKEVTETTTLRVSHDTRLGVASYKVISNTVQDHRENVDVKEIKDLERIVTPDVYEKANGLQYAADSGTKSESYSRRDDLSTKTNDSERVIKFAKVCEINQESRTIPADISKDMTLTLKEYTRHHEDSGIEMSPTKKDENLEGQDFLERAGKVSSAEASSMNGDGSNGPCCNCNCGHEPPCFGHLSVPQTLLTSVNENRRRLPLSNAS